MFARLCLVQKHGVVLLLDLQSVGTLRKKLGEEKGKWSVEWRAREWEKMELMWGRKRGKKKDEMMVLETEMMVQMTVTQMVQKRLSGSKLELE